MYMSMYFFFQSGISNSAQVAADKQKKRPLEEPYAKRHTTGICEGLKNNFVKSY